MGERSEPTVTGPKSGSREAVIEDSAGLYHPYRGSLFGGRNRGLASLTPGYLLSPLRGYEDLLPNGHRNPYKNHVRL